MFCIHCHWQQRDNQCRRYDYIKCDDLLNHNYHNDYYRGSGTGGPCPSSDTWLFDRTSKSWTSMDGSCAYPRSVACYKSSCSCTVASSSSSSSSSSSAAATVALSPLSPSSPRTAAAAAAAAAKERMTQIQQQHNNQNNENKLSRII